MDFVFRRTTGNYVKILSKFALKMKRGRKCQLFLRQKLHMKECVCC